MATLPLRGAQAAGRPTVPEFARKVGFDTGQIAALERGEIVARVLKTDRFRNVRHIRIGQVHNPPQASDFAGIGPGLAELQAKIDWKAKDVNEQVNRFARARLLAVTTDYMKQGTSAFKPLEDKSTGVSIDEQFKLLVANTGRSRRLEAALREPLLQRRPRHHDLRQGPGGDLRAAPRPRPRGLAGRCLRGVKRSKMAGAMKGALEDFLKEARENLQSRAK
jgi:hypothetical protein